MKRYVLLIAVAMIVPSCASMSTQQADTLLGTPAIKLSNVSAGSCPTPLANWKVDGITASAANREAVSEVGAGAEQRVLELVNEARVQAGLKPLRFSRPLANAARAHSARMAQSNFFEHRGPGEPAIFDRVKATGIDTEVVGENIFMTTETEPAAAADESVRIWLDSPSHRRNMLSPLFQKTGVAIVRSADGQTYFTQDFAR